MDKYKITVFRHKYIWNLASIIWTVLLRSCIGLQRHRSDRTAGNMTKSTYELFKGVKSIPAFWLESAQQFIFIARLKAVLIRTYEAALHANTLIVPLAVQHSSILSAMLTQTSGSSKKLWRHLILWFILYLLNLSRFIIFCNIDTHSTKKGTWLNETMICPA